jgi:hypothetical protein
MRMNKFSQFLLKKIYRVGLKITSIKRDPYKNLKREVRYISSLRPPKNRVESSYYQYLCQYKHYRHNRIILNLISFPALVALLIMIFGGLLKKRKYENEEQFNKKYVAIFDADYSILPRSLKYCCEINGVFPLSGEIDYDEDSLVIIKSLLANYWYEPHFVFKVALKVGRYSRVISLSKCENIICAAEYSFASSALTELCENKSIKHINVMHGDKFINGVDAFCSFHKFYVWDDHYIKLFSILRCDVQEFEREKPDLQEDENKSKLIECKYDFTYYMGWELSIIDIKNIKNLIKNMVQKGFTVTVRPHPRYGNRDLIAKIFDEIAIQYPEDCTMNESLRITRNALSLCSTVFWQARAFGRKVVIDDYSNSMYYKSLSEMEYYWVVQPHDVISKYI